jgi:alpha-1,6-mannosyltransferase
MHLADVTLFYSESSGGVRTYLESKRRFLSAIEGVRHTLVVPGAEDRSAPGCETISAWPIPFSTGYRFPLRPGPWEERLVALSPDVIEAGDPYVPAWAALSAGERLGVPVIGFYHSDLPRLVERRFGRAWGLAAAAYVRKLYRRFDRVLTPSRTMVEHLAALGVEGAIAQPLGVDTQIFSPARRDPALRAELGIPQARCLMVFAGRGAREKNLDVLLAAARLLGEDFHLLLVGSAMPHRVPENVTVVDRFVGREDVARILASADLLVHAGNQETFGLVVLEAMASGIPVVGVAGGAVSELVPPEAGRIAPSLDATVFAQTVRDFVREVDLEEAGRQARAWVERRYAWPAVLPGLLEHYRALCGVPALLPVPVDAEVADAWQGGR